MPHVQNMVYWLAEMRSISEDVWWLQLISDLIGNTAPGPLTCWRGRGRSHRRPSNSLLEPSGASRSECMVGRRQGGDTRCAVNQSSRIARSILRTPLLSAVDGRMSLHFGVTMACYDVCGWSVPSGARSGDARTQEWRPLRRHIDPSGGPELLIAQPSPRAIRHGNGARLSSNASDGACPNGGDERSRRASGRERGRKREKQNLSRRDTCGMLPHRCTTMWIVRI